MGKIVLKVYQNSKTLDEFKKNQYHERETQINTSSANNI